MAKEENIKVLERGNIYFLYRSKIGEFAPTGFEDMLRRQTF